ncbi:MAG: hypothetical protein O4860_09235, partial [Trichodesmium sp. St2_bin2_1]|nr:hypothetical protein [Trichodesmium sp. St2_bin2_1]
RSLGQKHSLAVAGSQGRTAMGVHGNQWYRPVLYLRWQDNEGGQLFVTPSSEKIIIDEGEDTSSNHPKPTESSPQNPEIHPDLWGRSKGFWGWFSSLFDDNSF